MDRDPSKEAGTASAAGLTYQRTMDDIRADFERLKSGRDAIAARTSAADTLVLALWEAAQRENRQATESIALFATGGYGRKELFPLSDLDLLFVLRDAGQEKLAKPAIRKVCQQLWDAGVRVSPVTRALPECDRFAPDNLEFTLSLLNLRPLTGDVASPDRARAAGAVYGPGCDDARTPCALRRHTLSPGTEYQGLPRRSTGRQRLWLDPAADGELRHRCQQRAGAPQGLSWSGRRR